jgi:hypothetical protein
VRQQICEAELVQAIGRGRGVNRTAESPLDVDILADVVLPVTVDEVQEWTAPGLEVEMVAEGVWLESPADMALAWPDVWATEMAAKNWLRTNTVYFPLIGNGYQGKLHRVRYHRAGAKRKWREAWVDPAVVPDARSWLEARLGPLSGYEVATILIALQAGDYAVAPPDFATPSAMVHPDLPHAQMCSAIDTQPPEYFAGFGITKESWQDWRAGGEGTRSGGELPWSAPVVEEVTDPVLVREIHAACAGAEEQRVTSPGGVPLVWHEVPAR